MCCHWQPPHLPKTGHGGRVLSEDGLKISSIPASAYRPFSFVILTSRTSPGIPPLIKMAFPPTLPIPAPPNVSFSIRTCMDGYYKPTALFTILLNRGLDNIPGSPSPYVFPLLNYHINYQLSLINLPFL